MTGCANDCANDWACFHWNRVVQNFQMSDAHVHARSALSDSVRPQRPQSARLLRPWDSPGKSAGESCHAFLQEIFPNQGSTCISCGTCTAGRFFPVEPLGKPFFLLAAAAAKLLQSCPTLCDPIDGLRPGFSVPGILQARTLEWAAISFSNAWKWKVKVKSLSRVRLLATPWTAAYQAPPSMGFSRQEYWSRVPLPSPSFSLGIR